MAFLDSEKDVLTPDEVASFLRVSVELLRLEIVSGRLPALGIGSELRILKQDLLEYLELAKRHESKSVESSGHYATSSLNNVKSDFQLNPSESFSYKWPDGTQETFSDAYVGTVRLGNGVKTVRIGTTERESAGRLRKRAVIFLDKRPMVEFVAADDFDDSGVMVSILKNKNGKQVRPAERIPPEYKQLTIEPYDKYIKGPYASSNLALVCSRTDLSIMVEHAVLRQKQIEARK